MPWLHTYKGRSFANFTLHSRASHKLLFIFLGPSYGSLGNCQLSKNHDSNSVTTQNEVKVTFRKECYGVSNHLFFERLGTGEQITFNQKLSRHLFFIFIIAFLVVSILPKLSIFRH